MDRSPGAIRCTPRIFLVVAIVLSLLAVQGSQPAGATWWSLFAPTFISKGFDGRQTDGSSRDPGISHDGRFIVFTSEARNLTGEPMPSGFTAVYWHDRATGETLRASEPTAGSGAIDRSALEGRISGCGRFVAFLTGLALVPEDTNDGPDYYVRDIETGALRWVDFRGDGSALGYDIHSTDFSADGSYLVFGHWAGDLLGTGRAASSWNVWGFDLVSNEATLVSAPATGHAIATRGSYHPSISGDGRYVAFLTENSWAEGDTNGAIDIYVRDLETGELRWIDFSGDGSPIGWGVWDLTLSDDGSRLAFSSWEALLPEDTAPRRDVYSYSLASMEATLVTGAQLEIGRSAYPSMSADGRRIMFSADHTPIEAVTIQNGYANQDIYVKDMQTGDLTRIPVMGHDMIAILGELLMSGNGEHMVFTSWLGLTPGDRNWEEDVYYAPATVRGLAERDERIANHDRFGTAVTLSQRAFPDGAATVVIATGGEWPDALSGAALAGALDCPILLVRRDSVPAEIAAEIARLNARNVYLIGGHGAISPGVEEALDGMVRGFVLRVAGVDRYATSRAVASRAIGILGANHDGTVIVASGGNFPDAVAATPLGAGLGWPVILVRPDDTSIKLPVQSSAAIIAGGESAVGSAMESHLRNTLGSANVTRIGGVDRYETAAMLAQTGVDAGLTWNGVGVATGEHFPDALTGGVALGLRRSTMLLTPAGALHPAAEQKITEHADQIEVFTVIGGTRAIGEAVEARIKALLER